MGNHVDDPPQRLVVVGDHVGGDEDGSPPIPKVWSLGNPDVCEITQDSRIQLFLEDLDLFRIVIHHDADRVFVADVVVPFVENLAGAAHELAVNPHRTTVFR